MLESPQSVLLNFIAGGLQIYGFDVNSDRAGVLAVVVECAYEQNVIVSSPDAKTAGKLLLCLAEGGFGNLASPTTALASARNLLGPQAEQAELQDLSGRLSRTSGRLLKAGFALRAFAAVQAIRDAIMATYGVVSDQIVNLVTGSDDMISLDLKAAKSTGGSTFGPPASWIVEPGRVGPLTPGYTLQKAVANGWAKADPDPSCGNKWLASDALRAAGLFFEARDGNPDDMDEVIVGSTVANVPSPNRTAKGIQVGSTVAQLKAAYGDQLHGRTFPAEGDYYGYVLFGAEGALIFNVGSVAPGDPSKPGPRVEAMYATRGSTMDNLVALPGGC